MTPDPVRPTPERANATGLPDGHPNHRERQAHAADCRGHLGDILFNMEDRVANLVRWAHALRDLGTCSGDVSADGLFAIGGAMLGDAKAVEADWKQCLELSRELQEASR